MLDADNDPLAVCNLLTRSSLVELRGVRLFVLPLRIGESQDVLNDELPLGVADDSLVAQLRNRCDDACVAEDSVHDGSLILGGLGRTRDADIRLLVCRRGWGNDGVDFGGRHLLRPTDCDAREADPVGALSADHAGHHRRLRAHRLRMVVRVSVHRSCRWRAEVLEGHHCLLALVLLLKLLDLLEYALRLEGLHLEWPNALDARGSVPVVAPLRHLRRLLLLEDAARDELGLA